MKENLVKVEKKTSYIVLCWIGILFVTFLAVLIWNNSLNEKNAGVPPLLVPILYFLMSSFFINGLVQMPNLFYNSVKIEFRTIFGKRLKTILFTDIECWATESKKNKYESWEVLTLVTKDQKRHKLYSYHFSDYDKIKHVLTNVKRKSKELENNLKRRQNIKYAIVTLIAGLVLLLIAFVQENALTLNETKEISGVLSEDIYVDKYKNTTNLYIYLEDYPKMYFEIKNSVLSTDYERVTENYKKGSSISFKISLEDFENKLQPNPNLNLIEKYWNPYKAKIVQLKDHNNAYVTLENYNDHTREYNKSKMLFFGFMGILLLFMSAVFYKNRNKTIS